MAILRIKFFQRCVRKRLFLKCSTTPILIVRQIYGGRGTLTGSARLQKNARTKLTLRVVRGAVRATSLRDVYCAIVIFFFFSPARRCVQRILRGRVCRRIRYIKPPPRRFPDIHCTSAQVYDVYLCRDIVVIASQMCVRARVVNIKSYKRRPGAYENRRRCSR